MRGWMSGSSRRAGGGWNCRAGNMWASAPQGRGCQGRVGLPQGWMVRGVEGQQKEGEHHPPE